MNTKVTINTPPKSGTATSENIVKLREITERLNTKANNEEYKELIIKLKALVDEGKKAIKLANTAQKKIKCYETMCSTITVLLKNIKIK